MLWRRVTALEEQQIELQVKQEDLENCGQCNNIQIRGIPRKAEGENFMAFAIELLQTIWGDPDASPLILNRAHYAAPAQRHPNAMPDILTRVHFFTNKEAILKTARGKADLIFQGHTIQLLLRSLPEYPWRRGLPL